MIVIGENSELKYELTVGAGHMDKDFSFILHPNDAKILNEDILRHATFQTVLYFSIQDKAFGEGRLNQNQLQLVFEVVRDKTLHTSDTDLARYISEQNPKIRTTIELFIKK